MSRWLPRPSDFDRGLEISIFLGWALVLGLGLLCLVSSRLRPVILISAVLVWLLALGPSLMIYQYSPVGLAKTSVVIPEIPLLTWMPYAWLDPLPFLGAIRTPSRAAFGMVALAAAALAIALGSIASSVTRRTYVVVLAGVGVLVFSGVPRMISNQPLEMSGPVADAFDTVAQDDTSRTVVMVPDGCLRANWAARFEIEHRHPVVGCTWFEAGIPFYSGLEDHTGSAGWASYRCVPTVFGTAPTDLGSDDGSPDKADLDDMAENLDVGWIILDKQPAQCAPTSERYVAIEAALRAYASLLGEDERFAVFALRP